jgi:hypothetical protein
MFLPIGDVFQQNATVEKSSASMKVTELTPKSGRRRHVVEAVEVVRMPECVPPQANQLSDWTQYDYDLDIQLATKLGFAVGGLSISGNYRVLIREFARSLVCVAPDGTRYRYGTSVRLVVRVTSFSSAGTLSLAVVAGETQVGRMQAESHLRVVGYVGEKLAELLPPFRTFNVDAYAEMSNKMNEIKLLIGKDVSNIRPDKLGVDLDGVEYEGVDTNEALGLIWGLSRLARGENKERAKQLYPDLGSQAAIRGIELAYGRIPGSGVAATTPTAAQREFARELLRGLELKK